MVQILVTGAGGRMGGKIISLILKNKNFKLVSAIEAPGHPLIGKDAGASAGLERSGVQISEQFPASLSGKTVGIDFTAPESTLAFCRRAETLGMPMVVGTTGFSGGQIEELSRIAEKMPVVYSPNMSIGVNMMFKILKEVALKLGQEYDMEIVELHHRMKKDAPSGTALKMARILSEAIGEKLVNVAVYGRQGMTGARKKKEIGIQSVRAGDIVGEHTAYFAGMGERLEITHKATSRDNFAQGALTAAAWVVNRPPGMYDMQDVLGLGK
ncbi:MAG: 4-hydroxy-tetrahydrodipicolinate reductase [Nitrospirae bacterium]|nr:4-hydroxy-tetrahydrodipicolinate reductase [Nitrospirota bacterium]